MLSKNPSGPSLVPDRSGPPKWSPFVFHHKLGSHSEQVIYRASELLNLQFEKRFGTFHIITLFCKFPS